MKKAIIIHGWDGNPNKGWFRWLKKELQKRKFKVIAPKMPNPEAPKIKPWLKKLESVARNIDEDTYFIGHSVGCQTIIRFLEKSKAKKVGGIIFVAGWLKLKEFAYTENPEYESEARKTMKPWVETKINFSKTKRKASFITYLISDDDPYVSLENARAFKSKLGAKIIKQHNKGHYSESKTSKIQIILDEIIKRGK